MIDAINITRPRYSNLIDRIEVVAEKTGRFPTNLATVLLDRILDDQEVLQRLLNRLDGSNTES